MIFKTTVGVEIAGRALRLAILQSAFGKLRLVRTVAIDGFLDLPLEEQKATLTKFTKDNRIEFGRVFLSLPRDCGIVRQIELPVEVREKLKSVVALQMETLSPWPLEDIYWDFAQTVPTKNEKVIRVTVSVLPRTALDPWLELLESVKLPLSGVSLSAVASAHAVSLLWAAKGATVVLDCEPGYVEGAVIQDSRLTSVTHTAGEVNEGARTAVERLISLSRLTSPENARLLVYGSAASLLDNRERISLPLENTKSESTDHFGAIAASLTGIKKTAFLSNLLPPALRYRRSQLQLIPTYILLALTALLGLAMVLREPYQLTAYASRLDDEIRRVSPVAREVSKQQSELNKLSEKYRALSAHFQNRDYNLEAVRQLARILPANAFIVNYAYQEGGITLTGFANSASEIQKILEDDPVFKDVQFTTAVTRDAKGKDRFTLKASIEVPK